MNEMQSSRLVSSRRVRNYVLHTPYSILSLAFFPLHNYITVLVQRRGDGGR